MEVFILDYLAFLLKSLTLVVLFVLPIVLIAAAKNHKSQDETAQLKIKHLNAELEEYQQELDEHLLDKSALKKLYKARKQQKNTDETKDKARVFVLEFDGDMQASESEHLADLLTILSARIRAQDEVVICLESGGGYVHRYGLAAAQLERLRQQEVKLTICVDAVAASGGYMMAAVANTIYAAPFALIGSVGVVANVPNFHRLLKKHEVDFEVLTAGEHKRTLTLFGENTPEGRDKFIEDLQKTHELFKQFIQQKRPQIEIKKIATGEVWYGQEALNLGLIDGLQTSSQYLQTRCQEANVYKVSLEKPQPLLEKLGINLVKIAEKTWARWQAKAQNLPKA